MARLPTSILLMLNLFWLAGASAASPGPKVGLWYTVWWTSDDQFHHWANCTRFPVTGRYSAGDPAIIARHFAQFREMGIDFLILDDTNCVGNDGGRINANIQAWFDFMDQQPAAERIPLCIGGGGEMREGGKAAQQRAADFYATHWANRPSYFRLDGKPLLLIDTDKNYGPGDFDDARFTVRWAYNGDNHAAMKARKTWGWGSYVPAPILDECMSIWPGHRFAKKVMTEGKDVLEDPRQGGERYVREWLRVLKAHPRFVTIADWNNFEEESAIEESFSWEDRQGYAVPDLYTRITRAYCHFRGGKLVKGECYQAEGHPEIYLYDGHQLVHQNAMPTRCAVIVVPEGALAAMLEDDAVTKLPFDESFKEKLQPGWKWVREDPKHWRITEKGLEVHVQPGNMWGPANDAKNVLVRAVEDPEKQPMVITASIANHPTHQYEQTDLVWYYDDSHMVKIGQEMVDGQMSIVMGREEKDRTRTIKIIPLASDAVELRLTVRGKRIRGEFKTPKEDWKTAGECDAPVHGAPHVALQFYQGAPGGDHWSRVSRLTIEAAR